MFPYFNAHRFNYSSLDHSEFPDTPLYDFIKNDLKANPPIIHEIEYDLAYNSDFLSLQENSILQNYNKEKPSDPNQKPKSPGPKKTNETDSNTPKPEVDLPDSKKLESPGPDKDDETDNKGHKSELPESEKTSENDQADKSKVSESEKVDDPNETGKKNPDSFESETDSYDSEMDLAWSEMGWSKEEQERDLAHLKLQHDLAELEPNNNWLESDWDEDDAIVDKPEGDPPNNDNKPYHWPEGDPRNNGDKPYDWPEEDPRNNGDKPYGPTPPKRGGGNPNDNGGPPNQW